MVMDSGESGENVLPPPHVVGKRFVRKVGSPTVWGWTEELWARGDMIECDWLGRELVAGSEAAKLRVLRGELSEDKVSPETKVELDPVVVLADDNPNEPTPSIEEVVKKKRGGKR